MMDNWGRCNISWCRSCTESWFYKSIAFVGFNDRVVVSFNDGLDESEDGLVTSSDKLVMTMEKK